MTEAEWLNGSWSSQGMLSHLRGNSTVARTKAGRRKLRLFACGCCRLIWEHLQAPGLRDAVEVSERFADGLANKEELYDARARIIGLAMGSYTPYTPEVQARTAARMAVGTTEIRPTSAAFGMTALPLPLAGYDVGKSGGDELLADAIIGNLLRCVFGNPFRPVTTHASWLAWKGGTVVRLAQAIYDERRFADLPILGDALEDAGCDNADILRHCREPGEHVRGCWVVDLPLGKM